jgi:exoribonuclease R
MRFSTTDHRINKKNRHDAYVTVDGQADDIFLAGMKAQNRALDGDTVLVSLITGKELEREKARVMEKRVEKQQQNKERQKKCEKVSLDPASESEEEELDETRIFGQVVYIVESACYKQNHVGTLSIDRPGIRDDSEKSSEIGRHIWFKPNDKRVPFIMIPTETVSKETLNETALFDNTLFTCMIKKWGDSSLFPLGEYTGKLGQMGQLAVESEALLVSAGVTWDTFSDDVLDSLPQTVIDTNH